MGVWVSIYNIVNWLPKSIRIIFGAVIIGVIYDEVARGIYIILTKLNLGALIK